MGEKEGVGEKVMQGVMKEESGYGRNAVSDAGGVGVMQ
ncbi:transglycosylase SLT domain-containing protein, partial [Bacillus altitudinis]